MRDFLFEGKFFHCLPWHVRISNLQRKYLQELLRFFKIHRYVKLLGYVQHLQCILLLLRPRKILSNCRTIEAMKVKLAEIAPKSGEKRGRDRWKIECVLERGRQCVCEREKGRERESKERDVCVCVRERESKERDVCVCERERDRVLDRCITMWHSFNPIRFLVFHPFLFSRVKVCQSLSVSQIGVARKTWTS